MKITPEYIRQLQIDRYWSEVRAHVCAALRKRKGAYYQWEYLAGRKSRTKTGERIVLDKKTLSMLQSYVDYYETTEGKEELMHYEISSIPKHVDDVAGEIMNAAPLNLIKEKEFQLFLKYRNQFLTYLKDTL